MDKTGWIIYNGHLPGKRFSAFAEGMQESAKRKDISTKIIKNNHLLGVLGNQESTILPPADMDKPDFVIFSDKDIPLARQLEQLGIPVFNSADAIETCDNKISTYQKLAKQNLPIPRTVIGPKIFPGIDNIDHDSFSRIDQLFDYPVVVKEAYGSFGEQVYLMESKQALQKKITELRDQPFVVQEFIKSSYGKDVRLNVVGDEVVASILRYTDDDFRANLANGKMTAYQPSEQEKELAIKATKAIGADYAGVDLLFGEDGPIICEVNSNAHIEKTYKSTGINVADYIVEHILRQLDRKEQA